MKAVLEVRGLGFRLPGDGKRETGNARPPLVEDVSFTVGAGETLVLLGRSGSGKTTTLKLINRLLEPTAGDVLIAGERAAAVEPTRLRRRIGYVIQEVGLFPHFTVAENVGLVPRLEGWPAERIAARVRDLLGLVGLDPDTFVARYPHQSGSPGPSPPTPRCSCSTSHSARSIPSPGSSCSASSGASRAGWARGWCS